MMGSQGRSWQEMSCSESLMLVLSQKMNVRQTGEERALELVRETSESSCF